MKKIFAAVAFVCLLIAGVLGCYQVVYNLRVSSITVLGWEDDQYLWGAGGGGVIRWDANQEVIVNSSFRPDGVNQFFISQEGQVWAYGDGIWRFEAGSWIERGESAGLKRGKIHDMTQTADNTIWVATWYGFKTWNEDRHTWELTAISLPAQTLVEASNGTLWFGLVQDGIIEQRPSGEIVHWTVSEGLVDNRVESLLITNKGTIWVGTRTGTSRWDGKRWQGWSDFGAPDADGLVVYKLYETHEGDIWAATSQDLARWDGKHWTSYRSAPFCGTNFALLETDDGNLWSGCTTGLFRWTGSTWREYGVSDGISNNMSSRVIQGNNGVLYASTSSGLYQYIPAQDQWQRFP